MANIQERLSGKNINFLIGSGASYPVFGTLNLGDNKPTIEELLSSKQISKLNKKAICYFYFKHWIRQMKEFDYATADTEVLGNYYSFINTVLFLLDTSGNETPKRANIFTTNYDLFFENTFENVLVKRNNCFFNDGSRGFINRTLSPSSYNLNVSEMGYYNNYKKEVPAINLLKMHGSVSWSKSDDRIKVSYENKFANIDTIPKLDTIDFIKDVVSIIECKEELKPFDDRLTAITEGLDTEINAFYEEYKKLAIINPNKWKFHETVFEQHYYQLIRNFSYELEKPNTVLMVFAFSFADEHIEEILKRSITNPSLEIYMVCFDEKEQQKLIKKFGQTKNIKYYPTEFIDNEGNEIKGDFSYFNKLLNGDCDERN